MAPQREPPRGCFGQKKWNLETIWRGSGDTLGVVWVEAEATIGKCDELLHADEQWGRRSS